MTYRRPIIERATELAASGRFKCLEALRKALLEEGYTQSDVFTLEGRVTARTLQARCAETSLRHADGYGASANGRSS